MNVSQLEVLIAIVDTGSLSAAAEAVSLTQSAVSYSLGKLETELGVTLLERGHNGIVITQIGDEVLHHARHVLSQIEIIRQKTAQARGLSVGKLRFGCVSTIPSRLLTGILRDFRHKYPDIDVVLFEGTPNELINWLASGVIDIGTVLVPDIYRLAVPFAYTEIKIIMSVDHRLAQQPSIFPDSLAQETFIGPKSEYGLLGNFPALEQTPLPRLRHEVSAHSTILAMVRENMGISMIPAMLFDTDMEGIVMRSLTPRVVFNVYLASPTVSPAIERFLESASSWAKLHAYLSE